MKVYDFNTPRLPFDHKRHGTYARLISDLLEAPVIHTGEWQGMDTSASKYHDTHELEDVSLVWDRLPMSIDDIIPGIDQSWADDHFLERVSGIPYNPAPSHLSWPYAIRGNADHTTDTKFDHTYPERFWPKFANEGQTRPNGRQVFVPHNGIRFEYGDLQSVVDLLVRNPMTRQAYLPVWFPEDTGAVSGQRVPCTLGYHFMIRDNRLTTRYYIRSCDAYRHLSNDVWFAGMLGQWMVRQYNTLNDEAECSNPRNHEGCNHLQLGGLVMHISSLHAFTGDSTKILGRIK
jgi:hypothetical protein